MKHIKKLNNFSINESVKIEIPKDATWTEMKLKSYYGPLTLIDAKGKYYLWLDSHSSSGAIEIDESTYKSLFKLANIEPSKM